MAHGWEDTFQDYELIVEKRQIVNYRESETIQSQIIDSFAPFSVMLKILG